MAKYRDYLPQIDGDFFLTHGGLETTSVLQGDVDVSHFAAIELMKTDKGRTLALITHPISILYGMQPDLF